MDNNNVQHLASPRKKEIPRKSEMSKPQSAPYIITPNENRKLTTQAGVVFARHCPLLVNPPDNNLLIQQ